MPSESADRSPRQERQAAAACPLLLVDRKHGTYGYSLAGGTDAGTGKRVQIRRSGFATLREAQQERAKDAAKVAAGRYRANDRMTVGEWLPRWLERRVRDGLRPSSERMYRRYVEQDLVPKLGKVKLADLRRHHVDRFVHDLVDAGRGATTVRRIHAVLSSALTGAERLELVDYNAASKIALPAPKGGAKRVWEPEQLGRFLDTAAAHRLGVLFEVAVFSGLRRGELAGLRWEDIDLERRELRVRQQRVQLGGTVVEGRVKTAAGQDRPVDLDEQTVGALLTWQLTQQADRERWAEAWEGSGYVFTRENGTPLRPAYISRLFEELVEQAKVPKMSVHGLRHQHASNLLAQGIELALISKRLGHSTLAVTSDMYSHMLRDAGQRMAEAGRAIVPRERDVHTLHTRSDADAPEEVVREAERPAVP